MKTLFAARFAALTLVAGSRLTAASASDEPATSPVHAQAASSAPKENNRDATAAKRSEGQPGQSANATPPAEKEPDPNSYANKETYPHTSSPDVSTAALIGGGTVGGGSPFEVSASVVEGRIKEWHLTAADIQAHLDRGEAIVRSREIGANAATGPVEDEALHTLINNRLSADIDTVRATSHEAVRNGEVTLSGKIHSAELLGRVIAITLDTPGVTKVTSEMTIDPSEPGTQRDDAAKVPEAYKSRAEK